MYQGLRDIRVAFVLVSLPVRVSETLSVVSSRHEPKIAPRSTVRLLVSILLAGIRDT
jgi:hypothetical protein